MTDNLVEQEETKLRAEFEKARDKWAAENPEIAEWAKRQGAQLAALTNYGKQLEEELEKLTGLFSTAIRLNGPCRMRKEDLFETYEALSQGKGHLALIKTNGDEMRAIWKVGPAPRSQVEPLVKKSQDLTDPED